MITNLYNRLEAKASKPLDGIKWLLILLSLTAWTGCKQGSLPQKHASSPVSSTFRNPLLPSGPDPWVIQKDGYYYYCHTTGNGIDLRKTTAMSQLGTAEAKTIWTPPANGPNTKNLWAPELHWIDGKWYMYYTAGANSDLGTQRTWVLENTSSDPTGGTWMDKGQIFHPTENHWAIDGTVLPLNGTNYFIWSGHSNASDNTQRIYIAQMSSPWTLTGKRIQLSKPEYDWEKNGDPDVNEGPQILQRNGKVFLIYSASGCWTDEYALGMLTMDETSNPLDSAAWSKSPVPVFTKSAEAGAYGPGHNAFFQSPDGREDWIIYHANPQPGQGCANFRSPRMQVFSWNADGSPHFGKPVPLNTAIPAPSGE